MMRKIDQIVVHCSDSWDNRDVTAADIRRWHEQRGWADIGYHFVIRRTGQIELGRALEVPGAHVKGSNENSVGICMVGQSQFEECQFQALHSLVEMLSFMFPNADTLGHYELNNQKTCPNIDMVRLRSYLAQRPAMTLFNTRQIRSAK